MTVGVETNRVVYLGAGITGPFAIPFPFLADGDIKVIKTLVAAPYTETPLVLTTDYTLVGAGDPVGGTLTLVAALPATYNLTIYRDPAVTQGVDYLPNDGFPAETHERALDRLTMIANRFRDLLARAFRLSDGDTTGINLTLPTPVADAFLKINAAKTALEFGLSAGVLAVSAFGQTLLNAVNAAAARVLLTVLTTKGDLWTFAAIDARLAVGSDGDQLSPVSGATVGLAWMRMRLTGNPVMNGKIVRSVAGNALTVALKDLAGNDPSAASPVYVLVQTQTAGVLDGGYAVRKVTAALSTVVSSGSTLGHSNAIASPVYTYFIDNAGTLELANSNKFFGYSSVQSSTAEGGAGAADSGSVLYSTTARASMVVTCAQRWKSTQAAAGTWTVTTGDVQLVPFPYKKPSITVVTATGNYIKPWDSIWLDVEVWGSGGGGGGSAACAGGQSSAGTGAGAGGYARKLIDSAIVPATLAVTIGVAPAGGGAGAAGTAGNNSVWNDGTNTLTGNGGASGAGGGATGNVQTTGPGGAGGAASGGDINITGGGGNPGFAMPVTNNPIGGKGGQAAKATSPKYNDQDTGGSVGVVPGGGGNGSATSGGAGGQSGGAGARGEIDVTEHYETQ